MKMTYRGSDPAPQYEHGETISGYGEVQSRKRVHEGWEYACWNKACQQTLYVYEPDKKE